jgi:hypothetical protein
MPLKIIKHGKPGLCICRNYITILRAQTMPVLPSFVGRGCGGLRQDMTAGDGQRVNCRRLGGRRKVRQHGRRWIFVAAPGRYGGCASHQSITECKFPMRSLCAMREDSDCASRGRGRGDGLVSGAPSSNQPSGRGWWSRVGHVSWWWRWRSWHGLAGALLNTYDCLACVHAVAPLNHHPVLR